MRKLCANKIQLATKQLSGGFAQSAAEIDDSNFVSFSPYTFRASSSPSRMSTSLRRSSISVASGYLDRRPASANMRAEALSCASMCILRVGLACRHSSICKASTLGCVSEYRALMGLVYQPPEWAAGRVESRGAHRRKTTGGRRSLLLHSPPYNDILCQVL